MEMKHALSLKRFYAPLAGKTARTPFALACWLVIANCSVLPAQKSVFNQDLDDSYAVKSVKLKKAAKQRGVPKDPRAYYNFLIAFKAEGESQFELAAKHYREVAKYDPETEEVHEKLAGLFLRSGQIDELLEVCRNSLEKFPDNPALNMIMADVLAGREDYYGAIKHYRKVTEVDPGGSRAYLLMGTVYDALRQYGRAEEMYRQVVLNDASNPMGQHFLAQSQMRKGDWEAAEASLGKATSLRPNSPRIREHFAWVLLKLDKTDEAVREYKLLLKLDPGNKKIRNYLEELKNHSASSHEAPFASKEFPDDLNDSLDVHMGIATVFYEQAVYLKALDEFQISAIRNGGKEPRMLISRVYELMGRMDKAIEEFEIIRRMEPESVDILQYMARLYSLDEQPEEVVRLVERAVALQPENDSLHHSLSMAYMAVEKYDFAADSMRTAITLSADKDSYYFELGALLVRSGQYSDAIENMQRAIRLNPMNSNAHNFIGYMYALKGQYLDKALAHLKKALSIQPRNGYFLDSLGWIYFKKGDSVKALSEIKKAMVYIAPDPTLYDHLGDVQFALKNYEEAHGAWKTSLSLTRVKMDDSDGGDIPDEKALADKINKVDRILRDNY